MLFTFAIDHRRSFPPAAGLTGAVDAEQAAAIGRAKGLALDAVLRVRDAGIGDGSVAILVDEQYGADVIRRARRADLPVAVPIEVSGRARLELVHGDDGFGAAIERVAPTLVKVLVRHHPDVEPGRADQLDRLARVQAWLDRHDRRWMVELLVPPSPAETSSPTFDPATWDATVRPGLTVRAVAELVAAGIDPAHWKLEGMPTTEAFARVAAATPPGGTCLVLGRGADAAAVDRWIERAAPVPGYGGFAVGRTLWAEPLGGVLAGTVTAAEAVEVMTARFARLVHRYLSATDAGAGCNPQQKARERP